MAGYAETVDCRRAYVLRYYGEEPPARCTGCDRCLGPSGAILPGWSAPAPAATGLLRRLLALVR